MTGMFDTEQKHDFDLEIVLDAFKACKQENNLLYLDEYLKAYQELCRFFHLTGRVFGFVAKDLEDKIHILERHRKSIHGNVYETIQSMIDFEVSNGITKVKGHHPSGSRTLLRLHRALEFILKFMNRIRESNDDEKTSTIAYEVYHKSLAKHHPWLVQKMAGVAIYMLPSRRHLIETMCKHSYEKVSEILVEVVHAGQPIYDITQSLYEEKDLLHLP